MCLWIINYQPGEIVHQSIVQLFGFDNNYHDQIRINNKYNWPIIQGLFKIFVQLHQGQNTIYLSTNMSDLAFLLLYQPLSTITIPLRLVYVTLSNQFDNDIEQICQRFFLLTQLVQCTFNEILYKQIDNHRSIEFPIESKIHHVSLLENDFNPTMNSEQIFKEIYRQLYRTDLDQVQLIVLSSISSSITFAYTFNKMIVLNLPMQLMDLPRTFDEFYQILHTSRADSLFYSIGVYLHELGHLFGLDHGDKTNPTIMSSSDGYKDARYGFFLVNEGLCSIIFNRQCSCYKAPTRLISCSYSNGVLSRHSIYCNSSCKSDTHCRFELFFHHQQKPCQCACNGRFQFELDHCQQLINRISKKN